MADLRTTFAGIKSPNPFWLASAPPTDKAYNVVRAFKAGWGGAVWKTLGEDGPPIVNTASRYGSLEVGGMRMVGFTNIELITDRPLQLNLDFYPSATRIRSISTCLPLRGICTLSLIQSKAGVT